MSVSAVADAELGLNKCMPADKAILMADLYKAPQLLNYYCLHECPIGHGRPISSEVVSIERVTVKLIKGLRIEQINSIKDKLVNIAEDGAIREEEMPDLVEVMKFIDDLSRTLSELKTIGQIALKRINSEY